MIVLRAVFIFGVLFLSGCGGDGSIVFDRNTLGNLWEKVYPPKDVYVNMVHFQNGDVLDMQHPIVRNDITVRLSDKTVIKDESCKDCTMNIVILPLVCRSTGDAECQCKIRTTRHDSNDAEICTLEGEGFATLAIGCPIL